MEEMHTAESKPELQHRRIERELVMTDEDNVIDAEIVDKLPAVIGPTHESTKAIKVERDWPQGPTPERRCKAHSSRTGEQCKNAALKGTTVCRFHGGAARHVKAAARARLDNAADLMARNLLGIALGGESESVRLVAIRDALDRSGITKPTEVVLSQGDKPYEEIFDEIAGVTRAESRRARGFLEPDGVGSNPAAPASACNGDVEEPSKPTGYEDFRPEYVPRDDASPGYQHRADPSANEVGSADSTPHPAGNPRGAAPDRSRRAGPPHITGQAALSIAADLAREQLALTSPHKRYKRP